MADLYQEARRKAEEAARRGDKNFDFEAARQMSSQERAAAEKAWRDANKK